MSEITATSTTIVTPAPKNLIPYYVIAVVFIFLLGMVGILGILYAASKESSTALIGQLMAVLTPTLIVILGLIKIQGDTVDTKNIALGTHTLVNSQMTEFKKEIDTVAFERGIKEGIKRYKEVLRQEGLDLLLARTTPEPAPVTPPPAPASPVVAVPLEEIKLVTTDTK